MNYEDLKTLDELRKNGSITEEEYQREKQKIFDNAGRQKSQVKPLFGLQENVYIALMHGSQLLSASGFGIVIPIVMWLLGKDENAKVDSAGKEIINFMISFIIYAGIGALLCFVLIGIPLIFVLVILYLVVIIMAIIKSINGEPWSYPMTIKFLK